MAQGETPSPTNTTPKGKGKGKSKGKGKGTPTIAEMIGKAVISDAHTLHVPGHPDRRIQIVTTQTELLNTEHAIRLCSYDAVADCSGTTIIQTTHHA